MLVFRCINKISKASRYHTVASDNFYINCALNSSYFGKNQKFIWLYESLFIATSNFSGESWRA